MSHSNTPALFVVNDVKDEAKSLVDKHGAAKALEMLVEQLALVKAHTNKEWHIIAQICYVEGILSRTIDYEAILHEKEIYCNVDIIDLPDRSLGTFTNLENAKLFIALNWSKQYKLEIQEAQRQIQASEQPTKDGYSYQLPGSLITYSIRIIKIIS